MALDHNGFMIIKLVPMLHGIIDSLCQTNQNVGIQVLINIESGHQALNKIFNFHDAAWIRGQFQYVFMCGDGNLSLSFSTIDNTPPPETYNRVSGRAIRIYTVRFLPHVV